MITLGFRHARIVWPSTPDPCFADGSLTDRPRFVQVRMTRRYVLATTPMGRVAAHVKWRRERRRGQARARALALVTPGQLLGLGSVQDRTTDRVGR